MPTRKNTLIGCGIGCAAVVLIVVMAMFGFAMWLNRPAPLLEPAKLLGSDTTGYVEWTLRLEDPGTRGLADAVLEMGRIGRDDPNNPLPDSLKGIVFGWQDRRNEQQMQELFPMVVTWSLRSGDTPEEDLHLLALSLESMANKVVMADWFLGFIFRRAPDVDVVRHGRENIYHIPEGPVTFFFRRNGVFFTSDVGTAKKAVDRLEEIVPGRAEAGPVEALVNEAAPERKLRGGLTNANGELARLWELLSDEPLPDALTQILTRDVSAVAIAGGFTDEADFFTELTFDGPDDDWARAQVDTLTEGTRVLSERGNLPIEVQGRADGNRVRVTVKMPDLPGFLHDLSQRLNELEISRR